VIKMTKLKLRRFGLGNLNPIPVMSRGAFVAFMNEWDHYLQGKNFTSYIQMPNLGVNRYTDEPVVIGMILQGNGYYSEIAEATGWVKIGYDLHRFKGGNSIITFDSDYNGQRSIWNSAGLGIDQLADVELSSNFMFKSISRKNPRLNEKLNEAGLEVKADEILGQLQKMISERSALVSRSLLGGYYL